jgi:hypothetical protein
MGGFWVMREAIGSGKHQCAVQPGVLAKIGASDDDAVCCHWHPSLYVGVVGNLRVHKPIREAAAVLHS